MRTAGSKEKPSRSSMTTESYLFVSEGGVARKHLVPLRSSERESSLGIRDFARLFGASVAELTHTCSADLSGRNFRYRTLTGSARDRVILGVLTQIASTKLSVAADRDAKERWERGWNEKLSEFRKGYDLASLTPNYFRNGQPLRLFNGYVKPLDENFELHWYSVMRHWLAEKFLKDVDTLYEFGCGTGHNLAALARIFPDKTFYGMDWASSSVRIVNSLSRIYGWKISGLRFDLSSPDSSLTLGADTAVLTVSALEQMGRNYEKFLQFLLRRKPAICIHVEPILEWYDANNLLDYLAIMYHRRRGYLEGFVPQLMKLESEGRVELLRMKRSYFGSLYTDGYSQIVWRPTARGS